MTNHNDVLWVTGRTCDQVCGGGRWRRGPGRATGRAGPVEPSPALCDEEGHEDEEAAAVQPGDIDLRG